MSKILSFIFFIAMVLLSSACRKDDTFSDIETTPPIPQLKIWAQTSGFITLGNGDYVAEATVSLGNEQVFSDSNGYYEISAYVNIEKAILTVEKTSYQTLFISFIPEENGTNRINISTYKVTSLSISGTTVGEVVMPKGELITIPSNAFKDELENIYTGEVKLFVGSPLVDNNDLFESISGDLQGLDNNGDLQILEPLGISNIHIEDDLFQPLSLNASIKIKMFKPYSTVVNSISEIPLWRFDQTSGIWKESGLASLEDGQYQADIDQTGYWIAATPTKGIELSGTVIYNNTFPDSKISITASSTTAITRDVYPTDSGRFIGRFPANENLNLQIHSPCGELIYQKELGSFSGDSNLGVLDLENDSESSLALSTFISGMVLDCSAQPANGGYVLIKTTEPNEFYQLPVRENGSFSGSILTCNQNALTIIALDFEQNSSGIPRVMASAPEIEMNSILNCLDGSSSVVFTYAGEIYTFPGCKINVVVTDSIDYRIHFSQFQQFGHVNYGIGLLDINGDPDNPNFIGAGFAYQSHFGTVTDIFDFNFPAQLDNMVYADQPGETVSFNFSNLNVIRDNVWSSGETMVITAIVE